MSVITDNAKFREGVRELTSLVADTMGPDGKNVMLTRRDGSFVFRDGAQVIRGYVPDDAVKRNAVQRLRDAAEATLNHAGDGTSTTTVLLGSLYLALEDHFDKERAAGRVVLRKPVVDRICAILTDMEAHLEENTIKVVDEAGNINESLLTKVATVAANNNAEIGSLVAGLIAKLGHSGAVKIEYSKSGKVETEVLAGYAFDGGLYSSTLLPYGEKQAELENAHIVLVNDSLTAWQDLKPITDGFKKHSINNNLGRWLVLVCTDLAGTALATALARQDADEQGRPTGRMTPLLCIRPPKNMNPDVFFEDMAALTGARVMSKQAGHLMKTFDFVKDAGDAKSVIASLNSTSIIADVHNKPGRLTTPKLIERLEKELDALEKEAQEPVLNRLNRLRGSVGVIRVPGATQGAVIMGKEVIEDSYLACQSAMKYGVLPGCGRALFDAFLTANTEDLPAMYRAEDIVKDAIQSVIAAVVKNAGGDDAVVDSMWGDYYATPSTQTFQVDARFRELAVKAVGAKDSSPLEDLANECLVDAIEAGVLDSAGGVIAAVRNTKSEIALWGMTEKIIQDA